MSDNPEFLAQWLSEVEIPLANKFYRTHKFRGKARRHDPCMVVRDGLGRIIASGCLRQIKGAQLLAGVAVAPNYQGQGVARLLLSSMEEKFDDQTFTFPYRTLVPFYRSLGFEAEDEDGQPYAILDRFHTYLRQGRDIVLMRFKGKCS